jgi:hypothetical protein
MEEHHTCPLGGVVSFWKDEWAPLYEWLSLAVQNSETEIDG